jgi:N-acetylneuraminate synthase
MNQIRIDEKYIGDGHPVFIIGEIGLNHNGDMKLAKKLIDVAVESGCDAVKFQKRDPELCVPMEQRNVMRDTPWGYITYMDYRYKVEFTQEQYEEIDNYCKKKNIMWTASCWDTNSVQFVSDFNVPFHKVASASITDNKILDLLVKDNIPIICSTGMSTMAEIDSAVIVLTNSNINFALLHCTSTYPCPISDINLLMIKTLEDRFNVPIGYSGHEAGLVPTWAAVAMGAKIIERHITLDRSMWGSDQSASVEPGGLKRLVDGIRDIEMATGDGIKVVYAEEEKIKAKLRG